MTHDPDVFGQLLQEKLQELDNAAAEEAALAVDEVEQLRLQAAHLVTGVTGHPWPTGAAVHYQQDPGAPTVAPPTLDIRWPARSPRSR